MLFRQVAVSTLTTIIITACGTMPVPYDRAGTDSGDQVSTESPVQVESIVLAPVEPQVISEPFADQTVTQRNAESVPEIDPSLPVFKTAKEYAKEALRALAEGNEQYAHKLLKRGLTIDANHKLSLNLIQQIEKDPVQELGSDYFEHAIADGESISKLAGLYLNDPMLFYWLARYNGLNNPGDIHIGQIVRIPGKQNNVPAQTVVNDLDDSRLRLAKQAFESGDYAKVVELLTDVASEIGMSESEKRSYNRLVAKAYFHLAALEEKQNNLDAALRFYEKALKHDRDNREYPAYVERITTKRSIDEQYKRAQQLYSENKSDEALNTFQKVAELQPGHEGANRYIKQLQKERVDQLYRQALAAQKRQELDKAIVLWDQYLILDATNESAKAHRERAVELKQNLQRFVSQ